MTNRSLNGQAYDQMKADLLTCALPPGSFHSEAELAGRYGTSKTPIRMALALLQSEGFVQIIPRRGIQAEPLTIEALRSTYLLRSLLEPHASYLAARNRTERQLINIDAALKLTQASALNSLQQEQVRNHSRFHALLAEASGEPQLARLVQSLHEGMERILNAIPVLGNLLKFGSMDAEILEAVKRGDAELARDLTEKSIATSNESSVRALMNSEGDTVGNFRVLDSLSAGVR